ncbi:hypothetical protein FQA39_LY11560 [Lamprigera yunnana]|nr:hypothetical protein FQA39_LY11560 [Lamprigera yunnana]
MFLNKTEEHHKCRLPPSEDIIVQYIDNGLFVNTRRRFRRFLTVSDTNTRSKAFLRSLAAIREERARHLQNNYYMIHPFSDARTLWEFLMIFVFFGILVIIPIKTAAMIDSYYIQLPKSCLDILCCCDICITFVSGYHNVQTKQIVLNRKKVAHHYLRTYFIVDLVTSIPTGIIVISKIINNYKILNILLYLKILRVATFLKYLDRLRDVSKMNIYKFKIFKLITLFCLALLWCTCIVYIFRGHHNEFFYGLLISCFQSLYNLLLIGYGYAEISDEGNIVFIIACLVIGYIMKLFVFAEVLHMFNTNLSISNKYQHIMQQLQCYIHYKQLSDQLKKKVMQFFEFKYDKSYYKEREILNTISDNLRRDIDLCICQKLVEQVHLFHDFPASFLMKIVKSMKCEIYLRGDVIIKAGVTGESMYFIVSGTVAVYTANGKEVNDDIFSNHYMHKTLFQICHLADGDHFGEIALVLDMVKRIATVVAIECCELYVLNRKDFLKAIDQFPEIKRKIKILANTRLQSTITIETQLQL